MKLNLRDFFWLILVAGLIVGWWLDRRAILAEGATAREQAAERVAGLEEKLLGLRFSLVPIGGGIGEIEPTSDQKSP